MALFGRKSIADVSLSFQEGVIGLILCVAAADGVLHPKERDRIAQVLTTHPPFEGVNAVPLMKKMLEFMKNDDIALVLSRCCAAVPAEYRRYAFAVSVDMALLDGNLADAESAVLGNIWGNLGIDDATARNVIETLVTKYGHITRS
ncbi:MAG: tellurite resistance TerB family protein [Hyphomonadaceae bacterium]